MQDKYCSMVKNMDSGARESWVQILAESITSYVTLGKLLKPLCLSFPTYKVEDKNSTHSRVVEIM